MSHPVNDEILDRLREEGEALGYTGEVLEKWIWMKFHQLPEGDKWKKIIKWKTHGMPWARQEQKNNVDPINVINALKGGWADSKVLQTHGLRMIKNDFKPRGKNFSQLKDMINILDCAKNKKLELPLSKIVKKMYNQLVKKGLGNYDHSSLYKNYK